MVKSRDISNQNPWWKHGLGFPSFDIDLLKMQQQKIPIERKKIDLKKGDICVIRGCRQVGKTVYMKRWIKELVGDVEARRTLYLSADRFFKSRKELRGAIDYFLRSNRGADELFIFLDEITVLRDWNLELKFLSDSGITQKARVIVTGSSGEALRRVGEQLPGRGLEGNEYYLKPLSFRQFVFQTIDYFVGRASPDELNQSLRLLKENLKGVRITLNEELEEITRMADRVLPFKNELEYLLDHYLRCGGFPMAINQHVENYLVKRKEDSFERDLVDTFVRTVLGELTKYGKNEMTASQILREIIDKYGSRFSFTKLASDIDMNHNTTSDYLDFLEKSFILSVLYAYDFNNKNLKYKGSKKVYFQDPFLYYSLKSFSTGADINEVIRETLEDEDLSSKIIEGIVFSHLSMSREIPLLKEARTFLWFYYDTRGRELDNVLSKGNNYLGIEIKYRNDVGPKDVTRIAEIDNYIIVSKEDFSESEDTLVVPIEVFLSLLETSIHNL